MRTKQIFKVPAILHQQTVLNTNVSLECPFLFSFLLLSFFSFKLSALLSQVGNVKHKCLSSFFLSFLSRCRSKSYASVFLIGLEFTIFRERKDAALCPSFLCSVYIRRCKIECPCLPYFSGTSRPAAFLLLIFLGTTLSSS